MIIKSRFDTFLRRSNIGIMRREQNSQNLLPTIFVILGATGDLMHKKLVPALFHLYREGNLPKLFQVVGFSKDELSQEQFQEMVAEMVRAKVNDAESTQVNEFSKFFVYQQGLFEEKEGYVELASFLGRKDGQWQVCSNKLFYLAVPPQFYENIFRQLSSSGLTEPCSPEEGWTRVIVEKPFGKDLQTAQELDKLLGKLFQEEQIYRIDHYLGKETVQNILAFRFSNSFLEPAWNKEFIEKISIRLWEKSAIADRGNFYDGIGALRDVGQNHMLQLLALFTMENPKSFEADMVRRNRAKVFSALKIFSKKEIVENTSRGQYEGYADAEGVGVDSKTETYFKIKTFVDTPEWKNVPIYLESGKAMGEDRVEVEILFRHPTSCLCPEGQHYQNVLHYQVQPKEGIQISFLVKEPGGEMKVRQKDFTFDYKAAFEGREISDAYERLLLSVIKGDQTLFVSTEEILAGWKFVDPIVRAWQEDAAPLKIYEKSTTPSG
jgi:glucose-6-phosphate 1-dehydrogenase